MLTIHKPDDERNSTDLKNLNAESRGLNNNFHNSAEETDSGVNIYEVVYIVA